MDINANGAVVACNMAYCSVLGNLHESSFEAIWFSVETNQIREVEVPLCRLPEFQLDTSPA